jgi:hypothetical protein
MVRRKIVFLALLVTPGLARADEEVVLHDTDVAVDRVLVIGTQSTLYAAVTGATDLDERRPLAGAAVDVALAPAKQAPVALAHAETGADGQAVVRFRVPRLPDGSYELRVHTRSAYGEDTVTRTVGLVESVHVHLRVDRPEYRPGQAIRWRVAALNGADAHPIADLPVDVAITDPRGTEIWRGRVTTGPTGMSAGAIPLADDLLLGIYTVRARGGGTDTSETVKVRAYELPPFFVRVERDRAGEPLAARFTGHVVAVLPYGEPVQGTAEVTIDAGDGAARVERGPLDAAGRFALDFPVVGDGDVHVTAVVTDGAKRRAPPGTLTVARPADSLDLAFIPESKRAAPGAPLAVTVVTTDGRGTFVPAQVYVKVPGLPQRLGLRSPGAARVTVPIPASGRGTIRLEASAATPDGRVASADADVELAADAPRALRLPEAVVVAGAPLVVEGVWTRPEGPIIATLLRRDAPLASTLATVDASGKLHAVLVPPPGTFGLASVRVMELDWRRADGRVHTPVARAPVYLLPTTLDVAVQGELRHKPGDSAELAVTVRDAAGRPAGGVGLAASVVDERILALGRPRPDLPTVLRGLDLGDARAAGLAFADLARDKSDPLTRVALRAIVEALPAAAALADVQIAAARRMVAERLRVGRLRDPVYAVLLVEPMAIGARAADKAWEFATPLPALIDRAHIADADRLTPWRRPTEWTYARRLADGLDFATVAHRIAEQRLDRLSEMLLDRRADVRAALHRDSSALARLHLPAYLLIDPWGTPVRARAGLGVDLISAGPDLRFGTDDDLAEHDVLNEYSRLGSIGHGSGSGVGYGYGGAGMGRTVRSPSLAMGSASAKEAAIRERFDETVLWVAGVETDAEGRARLTVPLADSITGWEVAVEAVGAEGAVGAARARLETFLPLHVDAEVPDHLTVGDAYTLPVVVANHTEHERTLTVRLGAEAGLERVGAAERPLALAAGATGAVHFPVRATAAGAGRILVELADGGAAVDAVRRTIRVEPPGSLVRSVATGTLREGGAKLAFELPSDFAAGSAAGRLRLFRGARDQSLDGIEGMLREPHGCFEQTSSTTYPNLLVLGLLGTQGKTAAARANATELVAKGYQRLLSFEVPGGGFSWFGEAPANQVLTAYGLLEFADMARVYPVDEKMVARTRAWLLGRQRADGSWAPDEHWLHDWSAVQGRLSTTAYIAWTLAESGYTGAPLDRALAFLRGHGGELAGDTYLLTLWAGAETARGARGGSAVSQVRQRLVRDGDGEVMHAQARTLFDASGRGADVQVTALAATALARSGAAGDARAALAWLWSARHPSSGWGSTQGNVLALRAAALAAAPEPPPGGTVRVRLDGHDLGAVDLGSEDVPGIDVPGGLGPGRHLLELTGDPALALAAELRLAWRTAAAPPASTHGLTVALTAPAEPTEVGAVARFSVKLGNPGKSEVAMPTVIVPVPPGFRADHAALAALVAGHKIARYEDQGSELRLYLTRLGPGASVELPYALEAAAECRVAQGPAQAYAYYDSDVRGASAGTVVVGVGR